MTNLTNMTNMTDQTLRIVVVGCGNIAQMHHLPTLAERPDLFAIHALVDPNEAALHGVGDRYFVPRERRFTSLDQALALEGADAVLIVHGGSHRASTAMALAAGKHVFVEKPLGYSVSETEAIVEVANKNKRAGVLMVGYQKRYNPAWRAAKELVARMRSEGLRFVDVTVLHPEDSDYHMHHVMFPPKARPQGAWAPVDEQADIRAAHASLASGPMGSLMDEVCGGAASGAHRLAAKLLCDSLIHDINLIRDALGEPEQVVSAHVWNGGMAQQALVRFAGDVHVNMSWVSVPGLKSYDERLLFVGPKTRVQIRFPSPYLRHTPAALTVERMDGETLVVEDRVVSHDDSFRLELHAFHAAARTGAAPETSIHDALGDARFISAIARAYR